MMASYFIQMLITRINALGPSVRAIVKVASNKDVYRPVVPWVISLVFRTSRGVVTRPERGHAIDLEWYVITAAIRAIPTSEAPRKCSNNGSLCGIQLPFGPLAPVAFELLVNHKLYGVKG